VSGDYDVTQTSDLAPISTADSALVSAIYPSPNIEPRRIGATPTILLMHYTGFVDAPQAIDWLARPESKVSCHYVIDETGKITQMVSEAHRAWHAGESCWHGERDINSASIGIEIQNPGHDRGYPDFPQRQMQAVTALSRDIIARHSIQPTGVLAHSDIAPHRKMDPGEKFDWPGLARDGVGHWVAPTPLCDGGMLVAADIQRMQQMLNTYGYDCPTTGVFDRRTELVTTAFQRHFRPARVDGVIDESSLATLANLIAARPEPMAIV